MNRREFIASLGTVAAWPLGAQAEQPAIPMIGLLHIGSPGLWTRPMIGFRQGLSEAGFIDRLNVTIETCWAEGHLDRLPTLAAELVRRHAAVVFANGPPAVRAVRTLSATIPIVFFVGEDPVKEGLVSSLSHPTGNITGITNFQNQLFGKQFGLLRELVPTRTEFAFLINPNNANAQPDTHDAQAAAKLLALDLRVLQARDDNELKMAFAAMVRHHVGGLVVGIDSFGVPAEALASLAAQYAIPAIYGLRDYAAAGGLMSYGASRVDAWRQAGVYSGQILKGVRPADLPVMQSTKFEFVINLKAAAALGLSVPPTLLALADEVIE